MKLSPEGLLLSRVSAESGSAHPQTLHAGIHGEWGVAPPKGITISYPLCVSVCVCDLCPPLTPTTPHEVRRAKAEGLQAAMEMS